MGIQVFPTCTCRLAVGIVHWAQRCVCHRDKGSSACPWMGHIELDRKPWTLLRDLRLARAMESGTPGCRRRRSRTRTRKQDMCALDPWSGSDNYSERAAYAGFGLESRSRAKRDNLPTSPTQSLRQRSLDSSRSPRYERSKVLLPARRTHEVMRTTLQLHSACIRQRASHARLTLERNRFRCTLS